MQIEALEIRNFRLLRELRLSGLPRFGALVGVSGSGKSMLFDVFAFLREAMLGDVTAAVARRGGYRALAAPGMAGEPVELSLRMRLPPGGQEQVLCYTLRFEADAGGRPVIVREKLYQEPPADGGGAEFIEVLRERTYAIACVGADAPDGAEPRYEEQSLHAPDTLAVAALGQFRRFAAASALRAAILGWRVVDLDACARPHAAPAEVGADPASLAQAAGRLHAQQPERFALAVAALRQRVPGLAAVEAETGRDGRCTLRFRDAHGEEAFDVQQLAEGTRRLFAWLLLLHEAPPHSLLALETPECRLHPDLLPELADLLRAASLQGTQVLIATHAPALLNALTLDEILCLRRDASGVSVTCAGASEDLRALYEAGEAPGRLWAQGLFEAL